jgi:hypothetical protein
LQATIEAAGNGTGSRDVLAVARAMAFQWLLAHRDARWGWDPSTPEVIHALWSTNASTSSGYVQSIKELEIEMLMHLCKSENDSIRLIRITDRATGYIRIGGIYTLCFIEFIGL